MEDLKLQHNTVGVAQGLEEPMEGTYADIRAQVRLAEDEMPELSLEGAEGISHEKGGKRSN